MEGRRECGREDDITRKEIKGEKERDRDYLLGQKSVLLYSKYTIIEVILKSKRLNIAIEEENIR